MNDCYEIKVGNSSIKYSFCCQETFKLFDNCTKSSVREYDINISSEYMNQNKWLVTGEVPEAYLEYRCLMLATGNYLLEHQMAMFHGASFLWKGKAWIFTAPSGTGKTTQLYNWLDLYGNEIQLINGDKTILENKEDGTVWAYSSPWKGKENLGNPDLSAPLGGIILLEQGPENRIEKMNVKDAVIPLFIEFIHKAEKPEQLHALESILDHILDMVPVFKLINTGDKESAELTYKTLLSFQEKTDYEV